VVDLAIAANFVRELTEEQFEEQRRNGRRGIAERRPHASSAPTIRSVNGSDAAHESGGSAPTRDSRARKETAGFRRALARLVQVRG
jgi:hypothetical protein